MLISFVQCCKFIVPGWNYKSSSWIERTASFRTKSRQSTIGIQEFTRLITLAPFALLPFTAYQLDATKQDSVSTKISTSSLAKMEVYPFFFKN